MTNQPKPQEPESTSLNLQPLRPVGQTGLQTTRFALGFWHSFGVGHTYELQRNLVLTAFDQGVTHFDNANRYGPPHGHAEEVLGKILREDLSSHRHEILIASKGGNPIGKSPYAQGGSLKHLRSSIDDSLRRLGLDYVDIYYHHSQDDSVPVEETAAALAQFYHQGKALYIGVSNYSPKQTQAIYQELKQQGVRLALHQFKYNLLEQEARTSGLLDTLRQLGVGASIYSPLAQGLLTDKYLDGQIPKGSRSTWSSFLTPDFLNQEYLDSIQEIATKAKEQGISIPHYALSWLLSHQEVSTVILGASRLEHLLENLSVLQP